MAKYMKEFNGEYYNFAKILFDRVIENINNEAIELAFEKELIEDLGHSWLVTNKGHRFLNDLLELFV